MGGNDIVKYATLGAAIGWLASLFKKGPLGGTGGHPYPTPKNYGVPFAPGPSRPVWPIDPKSKNSRWGEVAYRDVNGKLHGNAARAFRASRSDGSRYHIGIDLYADAGDVVLAPEDGVIVSDQNFLNTIPGEDAMLIQTDSGTVILLGEIVAESMTTHFGLKEGSRVKAGQPVAVVGLTSNGSHMLHFETYRKGTTHNDHWYPGKSPPHGLLDPTVYLLRAKAGSREPEL